MKVSVTMTTYNHERWVAQALDGVLMQKTDFDVELIVGDDCSTDATRRVIEEYRRRHPALIRTVYPPRNLGAAGRDMFVETLRVCRGELIAMLDGDDYWTAPDKLRRQVHVLETHPECSMCYHNVVKMHEDGSAPPRPSLPAGHPAFSDTEDLLWACFVPSPSPMVRREVVAELPPWYLATVFADWALYLLASERGRLGYLDETMAVHRMHAGGAWSGLDRLARIHGVLRTIETLGEDLRRRHARTIRQMRAYQYFKLARLHATRGHAWRAMLSLLTSLRLDPHATRAGHSPVLRLAWRTARGAAAALRPSAALRASPAADRRSS